MPSIPAGAPAAPVYPAGRAAALFAVCEPELAGRRLTVDGRRIVAVPCARFSLLLTYVDRGAYGSDELERRRDDARWQALEARVYERAIERASRYGAVLPLPPLTIVPDAGDLPAYARERSARWARALARVGRRRECALHIFAGPHSLVTREPYSIRIARNVLRSSRPAHLEGTAAVVEFACELRQACTSLAFATRRIEAGGRRGLVWSAALLIAGEEVVPKLEQLVTRATREGAALGVSAYLEGPRPPFSFA